MTSASARPTADEVAFAPSAQLRRLRLGLGLGAQRVGLFERRFGLGRGDLFQGFGLRFGLTLLAQRIQAL